MSFTVAVVGAGRMGSIVGKQLPEVFNKVVIDNNVETAKSLADEIGGSYSEDLKSVENADVIAVVLPTSAVRPTMTKLAEIAKDGAIILNMATSITIEPETISKNPHLNFVESKIIGHAASMG